MWAKPWEGEGSRDSGGLGMVGGAERGRGKRNEGGGRRTGGGRGECHF